MSGHPFNDVVSSLSELRAMMGEPSPLALAKDIARLDEHCRAFIAHSPFVLVATSNARGQCDVSPKGDAPGFVRVLDDAHLLIPDRPGNKRIDGLKNLLENPHVGLIFLIPGREETLRINGRAWICRDAEMLASMEARGKRPQVAIGVEVEECFQHCAKAFKRSGLWEPAGWPDLSEVPSGARVFLDHARPAGMTLEQMERRLDEGYRTQL